MEAVREYRLSSAGLAEAQRIAIRRYWAPQLLIIAAVLVLSFFLATRKAGIGAVFGFGLITALLLTYIFFVVPQRAQRRLATCWDSYKLTVGSDYLLRQQGDTPDIRLPFSDVKRVERLQGRYLRVIGSERFQVIGIPESIENFEEVLAAVCQIARPANLQRDRSLKGALLTGAGFAVYLVMLWSRSPQVVLPLALVVGGLLVWLFVYMRRSPNISRRNKNVSWVYLLCIGLCILKVLTLLPKTAGH